MPIVKDRVDLIVAPLDPTHKFDESKILELFCKLGWVNHDGTAGSSAGGLIQGGFSRLWVDVPNRIALLANQQGGFRVACPTTGDSIIPAFTAANALLRKGGQNLNMDCTSCGSTHRLDGLAFRPPAIFSAGSLLIADVKQTELSTECLQVLNDVYGEVHYIARRVS